MEAENRDEYIRQWVERVNASSCAEEVGTVTRSHRDCARAPDERIAVSAVAAVTCTCSLDACGRAIVYKYATYGCML